MLEIKNLSRAVFIDFPGLINYINRNFRELESGFRETLQCIALNVGSASNNVWSYFKADQLGNHKMSITYFSGRRS